MGGDHKCPVCQATFTRPQHVARHMRSHTGDRPYKCQYCGDQFARSDLLSRHVNKCHPDEKPLPNTTTGARRRGSASASRATTSKQACDQCVQSTLPCDGSNPCSKCVSRKCRCTYVKFHRQTAPSGPGHHAPRSSSTSSSVSSGIESTRFPPHLDDFILAPPPSTSVASNLPASDQIFNTPFTFNPAAPSYPPNWTAAEMTHLPFSMASDADMAGKYRAQAEYLRRAGHSILSNNPPTMLPSIYAAQQHPHSQPPPGSWYPSWGESGAYPLDDTKSFDGIARTHSLASSEPASFAPEIYGTGVIGSGYRPRRSSFDFSDSSSATSHSMPSSATSSSVHLPLPGSEIYDGRSEEIQRQAHDSHMMHHPQRRSSIPTSQPPFPPPSEPPHPAQQQPHHRIGEGGFSSAFGLMSIDDQNVLAGLSSDGVPFFSHVGVGLSFHSPNQTPMPTRMQHPPPHQARERGMSSSALQTPGVNKDADTRELKDFWKAYMRSPLSGSGSVSTLDSSAPPPLPQSQMPHSPTGQRRRMRVSSLPSVTPTVEKGHPLMMNGHGAHGESSTRTMYHGNHEDLRSYEAAVNARNASLKFNLVPRRKGTRPSSSASPPANGGSLSFEVDAADNQAEQGLSRPSSSSSTSSLAQAFTLPSHHHHPHPSMPNVVKPPPMQGASISLPIPPISGSHGHSVTFGSSTSLTYEPRSRESSVASDGTGGTGGSGSDGEVMRPSFKRYPSQTLGPTSSKRALVERRGGKGVEGVKVENGVGSASDVKKEDGASGVESLDVQMEMGVQSASGASGGVGQQSRPIAALPERAKRG